MEVDGEEFKYLEGGQGETIVFIHGLLGSKTQWRSIMQAYTGKYRVIAFDIPGLCQHNGFNRKKHSLGNLSGWLEQVISQLRVDRVHLVCHSMGCALGAHFAATHPHRVNSLAFLAFPNLFGDRGETYRVMIREFNRAITDNDMEVVANYYRNSYAKPPTVPGIVMRYNLREIRKQGPRLMTCFREVFDSSLLLLVMLKQIEAPCLIINGDQDYICELTDKHFWEASVAFHRFVILPECGHMIPLEKPDDVIYEHTRFLERMNQFRPPNRPVQSKSGNSTLVD